MTAAVVAQRTADGGTRCTTLRSAPPISLRETPEGLYLVASGAGPLGGDHLSLDLDVSAGASIVVRSAGAGLVLPGPTGAPSSLDVRARVAGSLTWAPEPTILAAGCDHTTSTRIELTGQARVEWRESIVLGRHGEASGSLLHRLWVDRDGRSLLRNEVPLGPRWPGSAGPAGTDGARVVSSTLVVGRPEPTAPAGAVLQLAPDAWLVTELTAGVGEAGAATRPGPASTGSPRDQPVQLGPAPPT